ncbi:Excalibur calcium-binding domain-containing protein [Friedmanniella luteola]|uniref:Excalibur calcium-binding domain-containing protein n=1 Tax=Friedmanniella luteola TaxID=546871 RepID=A0A1H1WJQ8_9ACTN|nr:excalibur calcium-binding domain-containing protein [Friedmanniella luteola]SDS97548.1 Excalibur calcium-binding domain-containing protein [Friedmanniella luteola]
MKKLPALLTATALALTGLAATTPAADAATNVCAGVSSCRVVASSDIDGDKEPDQVGIALTKTSTIVRVKTATRTMQTTSRDAWSFEPLHGIAAIDGVKGNEIVIGDLTGANTYWYRVITHRSGKLVTLNPGQKSPAVPNRWGTQASFSAYAGYSRTVSSTGAVSLVEKYALRNDTGSGYTGKNITYAWSGGKWVKKSTKTARYSSAAKAKAIYGWRIKGLPIDSEVIPRTYKSCTALVKDFPHGVGRFNAKDKTTTTPVTNFKVAVTTYYLNNGPRAGSQYDLDRDNDGIACEKH